MTYTPTDDIIETATEAGMGNHDWEMFEPVAYDVQLAATEAIRTAIETAAPLIAAQTLRDAADAYRPTPLKVGTAPDQVRAWLRNRAATLTQETRTMTELTAIRSTRHEGRAHIPLGTPNGPWHNTACGRTLSNPDPKRIPWDRTAPEDRCTRCAARAALLTPAQEAHRD